MQTPCRRSSKAGRKVLDLCLTVVIFEPGYGSGKQGKERVFITTDELPHIRGDVLDFARQDPNQKLTTHGVFSAPASIENVSFGSNTQSGQGDGFTMDFGKDVPHNNLSPCVAAYGWRRTA